MPLGGPIGANPFGGEPLGFTVDTAGAVIVSVSITRVIGSLAPTVELPSVGVSVVIGRVIGAVSAYVYPVPIASPMISRIIGRVRITAESLGSPWVTPIDPEDSGVIGPCDRQGLPVPLIEGYRISGVAPLLRTEMESGVVRQRLQWLGGYRRVVAKVALSEAELVAAESIWSAVGAGWWKLPLVSGDEEGTITLHTVRLAAPVQVQSLSKDHFEATMDLDIQ